MDYEELYQKIQPLEKAVRDKLAASQKNFRNLQKDSEAGDLKSFTKNLALLEEAVNEQVALLAELKTETENFDVKAYFEEGDFAEQLEYEIRQQSVDIKGEFPLYEVFPFKVRIDTDNLDLAVDRKKVSCIRPKSFAKKIKADLDRLYRAAFNAASFANELCAAYDLAISMKNREKSKTPKDADILLKDLHLYLAPMQRFRREYDAQAYAFDLSRLFASDVKQVKDGRAWQFGTGRARDKMIRLLDAHGHEHMLATIRFYQEQEMQ